MTGIPNAHRAMSGEQCVAPRLMRDGAARFGGGKRPLWALFFFAESPGNVLRGYTASSASRRHGGEGTMPHGY